MQIFLHYYFIINYHIIEHFFTFIMIITLKKSHLK